jgi:hypothetical protein
MDVIGKLIHILILVTELRSLVGFTRGENVLRTYWVGNRTGLDLVAKRTIFATAGNRTPVSQSVAWSLY